MKNIKSKLIPYFFILPNLIIFMVFVIIPAFNGIYYSFTDYNGLDAPEFIGLDNYKRILNDPQFIEVFVNTITYSLFVLVFVFIFALLFALLLQGPLKAKGFFRAVFYWPTMISFVIVGLIWRFGLGDELGIVNYLLELGGQEKIKFLTHGTLAFATVIIATVWCRAGFYMVMFISGLQSIPESYYEACKIDGANKIQTFIKITFPLLKPTNILVLVLLLIDAFKSYPLILSLTGGGPGMETTFLVQHIFTYGFEKQQLGYASAMSVIMFAILCILVGVQFKYSKGGVIN